MSPEAISTCSSMSSLRPCAATTASSRVRRHGVNANGPQRVPFPVGFQLQSLLNEEGRCSQSHAPPTGVIQQHTIGPAIAPRGFR